MESSTVISLRNKDLAACIFLGALKFSSVIIHDASDKKSSVQLTRWFIFTAPIISLILSSSFLVFLKNKTSCIP